MEQSKKNNHKSNFREQSQEKILEASLKLFLEQGFENTSTREIANLAKCSEALIFKYFTNKKNLLCIIISNWFNNRAQALAVLDQSQNIDEEIHLLIRWFFVSYLAEKNLNKLFVSQILNNNENKDVIFSRYDYVSKRNSIISQRIAKYGIPFDEKFTQLLDIVHGYVMLIVLVRNTPVEEYEVKIKNIADMVLTIIKNK